MVKTRSFLKWAGNKYNCLQVILSHFPRGGRLVEPFTGSGVVFLNTEYSNYLLGEENLDLIRLYRYVQREGESFIRYCQKFFVEQNNNAAQYYYFRDEFNQTKNLRKKAALFLYLNRHGYNGLCRYNHKGVYNVPFGQYVKPYFPSQQLAYFHLRSKNAQFIHSDFRETFKRVGPNDLIYCDPPYVPLSDTAHFSHYTQKKFTHLDQIELANLARQVATKGATVIISNHDTPFIREHYHGSEIISFPVSRLISCNAKKRRPVNEVLAIFSTASSNN